MTNGNCEGVHILTPLVRGSPLKAGTSSVDSEVYSSSSTPAGPPGGIPAALVLGCGPATAVFVEAVAASVLSAVVA